MEALLVSIGVVAVSEIGDKTQLLAFMLAARFRRPLPIIMGILCATLANHAMAGALGDWVRTVLSPEALRWGLGLSFIAIAIWALVPDKLAEKDARAKSEWGVFGATLIAFFLAEIGDKTQLATVMLAAKYDALITVVTGTTLGMLIADVPAVLVGQAASPKVPIKLIRFAAAGIFAALGIAALVGVGKF